MKVISETVLVGPPEQGGKQASAPQSSLLLCSFLLMSPLNVLFLKEVTKNVQNQHIKKKLVLCLVLVTFKEQVR